MLASTSLPASLLLGLGLWHQSSSSRSSAGQVTLFGAPGTRWVSDWVPLEVSTEAGPWPDKPPLCPTHIEATRRAVPTPCFLYPLQRGRILPPSAMALPSRHRLQPAPGASAISLGSWDLLSHTLRRDGQIWVWCPQMVTQKSGRSTAGS